jgi:hypothetical protein
MAGSGSVVWHGPPDEWQRLSRSVERHCACQRLAYRPTPVCASHQLLGNQAALDRLVFARGIAPRLRREESLRLASTQPWETGPGVESEVRS